MKIVYQVMYNLFSEDEFRLSVYSCESHIIMCVPKFVVGFGYYSPGPFAFAKKNENNPN